MEDEEPKPTAVEKYFFSPVYYPRDTWSVIKWWESRRPLYNLAVGTAGVVSLSAMWLSAVLHPFPMPMDFWPEGLVVVGVYGLAANLCYSLGAPIDLVLRRILGDRAPAVSAAMFRYGFVFSIGLTLLPISVAALSWVARWFIR